MYGNVYLKTCLFSKSDFSTAISQILAKVQTFTILKICDKLKYHIQLW